MALVGAKGLKKLSAFGVPRKFIHIPRVFLNPHSKELLYGLYWKSF